MMVAQDAFLQPSQRLTVNGPQLT